MKPSERISEIYNENKDSPETANMTFPSQYVRAILQHLDEQWEAEKISKQGNKSWMENNAQSL